MTRGHRLPGLKARRIAGGLSVTELARRAAVSDQTIIQLENGGNCDPNVSPRILQGLAPAVAITSSSIANPSVITTAANAFVSGDTVTIAGHTSVTPAIDGDHVITVESGTEFSIPVNVTADGVGGTATLAGASVGLIAL